MRDAAAFIILAVVAYVLAWPLWVVIGAAVVAFAIICASD